MKNSHKKIISKIYAKIGYYELLSQGQLNDGDAQGSQNTNYKIDGLRECLQVIEDINQKHITKSILKEASKFLCIEDLSLLETINIIITNYNESGDMILDLIDEVQVIEKFEFMFSIGVFLNLIGIKHNSYEKINLLS